MSRKWGDRIPIGIFYQKESSSYNDRIHHLDAGPLIDITYEKNRVQQLIDNG